MALDDSEERGPWMKVQAGAFMRASEQGAWSEDLRSVLRQMRESWRDPPAR